MPVVGALILVIEFVGGLIIAGHCAYGLILLFGTGSARRARVAIIEGALWGLGFKVAATLLKTIQLESWHQLLIFALILALRTLVKMLFTWESRKLASPRPAATPAAGAEAAQF